MKNKYDPNFGDNKLCVCGHQYHRHFDSYENMEPVGCKYCGCLEFKEEAVENKKDHVVIEYDGMRYVFDDTGSNTCTSCLCTVGGETCKLYKADICTEDSILNRICTSATKIENDSKVYGPHMYDDAKVLINNTVGIYNFGEWKIGILSNVKDRESNPYLIDGCKWYSTIREIKPETITLTEARERFNIPDNVIIKGE